MDLSVIRLSLPDSASKNSVINSALCHLQTVRCDFNWALNQLTQRVMASGLIASWIAERCNSAVVWKSLKVSDWASGNLFISSCHRHPLQEVLIKELWLTEMPAELHTPGSHLSGMLWAVALLRFITCLRNAILRFPAVLIVRSEAMNCCFSQKTAHWSRAPPYPSPFHEGYLLPIN